MKLVPIVAAALVLLIPFTLPSGEAAAGAYQTFSSSCGGSDGQVESLWADDDMFYSGTADGYVYAVDRDSGRTQWVFPRTIERPFSPGAAAIDMVGDDQRIYVAYANTGNGFEDPVFALDRATGEPVWRQTYAKNNVTVALDPFRLAQDASSLYIGKDGGQIFKVHKSSGQQVLRDGQPMVYFPSGWEAKSDGEMAPGFGDPNAIWALEVRDGALWAGRNWGDHSADLEVNQTDFRNSMIHLNTEDFSGGEKELTLSGQPTNWAVHGLWVDGQDIYVVGAGRGNNGPGTNNRDMGFFARAQDTGTSLAMQDLKRTGLGSDGLRVGDVGEQGSGNSVVTAVLDVMGDATHVYTVTANHPDTGMGYVLKHDKGDLDVDPNDWGPLRSLGRGPMRAVHVDPAPDGVVFAGSSCGFLGLGHPAGIVASLEKSLTPVVELLSPANGEFTKGRMDIALRATMPSNYVGDLTARFFLSNTAGDCADGASCYNPLGDFIDARSKLELGRTFNPNQVVLFRDINMLDLPPGKDYILRVEVEDDQGRVGHDHAEFPFVVDHEPPTVSDLQPLPGAVLQDRFPHIMATYRDDLSLVDVQNIRLIIDGVPIPIRPSFVNENGLDVDLGHPDVPFGGLKEGFNNIRLSVPDRSGNTAVHEWKVKVDTQVKAPVLNPTDNFVQDVRPIISAQFFEDVSPTDGGIVFHGTDVTAETVIIPPQGGLGTRLVWRPSHDLNPGTHYTISFAVQDTVGNLGGPYTTSFRIDPDAPLVRNMLPQPGALLTDDRPLVRFTLQDAASGIDPASVALFLDGTDVSRDLKKTNNVIEYRPNAPLQAGAHTVTVIAMDGAGNMVTEEWGFRIDVGQPVISIDTEFPGSQTAVKQGDEILVRVTVVDDSPIRSVRIDAQALDPSLPASVAPGPVAGQPGVYELSVAVREDRTRNAVISIIAEDMAGLVGFKQAAVRVDNTPPHTVVDELPEFVGKSFELTWKNTPKDETIGGSGVAYYRVEQQGNGEWSVLRPRHTDTSLRLEVNDGDFATLRFRIFAVDNAGNVQAAPSNVVQTVVRGDPFPAPVFPERLVRNGSNVFQAEPAPSVPLQDGQAFVRLTGVDAEHDLDLDAYGRFFAANHDLEQVIEGDYVMRFHFRDHQGFEMVGQAYAIQVVPVGEAGGAGLHSGDAERTTPAVGALFALAAAAVASRRWRP